jgi:hypothetical protein
MGVLLGLINLAAVTFSVILFLTWSWPWWAIILGGFAVLIVASLIEGGIFFIIIMRQMGKAMGRAFGWP